MKPLTELIGCTDSYRTDSLRAKTYKKICDIIGRYYISNTTRTGGMEDWLTNPIQREVYEGINRT